MLVSLDEDIIEQHPFAIEIYDGRSLVGKTGFLANRPVTPVIAWQGDEERNLHGFVRGSRMTIVVKNRADDVIFVHQCAEDIRLGQDAYALIDLAGDMGNDLEEGGDGFEVGEGYPSPFNPSLSIPFTLPQFGEVKFVVYNILGRKVFEERRMFTAGTHRFEFNAGQANSDLASGVYMVKMTFGSKTINRKAMLVK